MATFVLDTSAILTVLNREDGLDTVHKDPEFERVPGLKMLKLPYKG